MESHDSQPKPRHILSYPLAYPALGFAVAMLMFAAVLTFYLAQAQASGTPLTVASFFDHVIAGWAASLLFVFPVIFYMAKGLFIRHFSTIDSRITLDEFLDKRDAFNSKAERSDEDCTAMEEAARYLSFWDCRRLSRIGLQELRDASRRRPHEQDPDLPPMYNPPDVNLNAADWKEDHERFLERWAGFMFFGFLVILLIALAAKSMIRDPTLHPSWPRPDPDTPWFLLVLSLSFGALYLFLDHRRSQEKKEIARLRSPIPLVPVETVFEPLLQNRAKLRIHVTLRMPQEYKSAEQCQLLFEAAKAALARKLFQPEPLSADPYQELHDFIGRAFAAPARELNIPVLLWTVTEIEGLPPNPDTRPDRIFL